jgi:Zn finger protein HypA/HybF involved in hydrogenase expression
MKRHDPNKEQSKNEKTLTSQSGKRRCLGCQKVFASEGAHHRICDNCKTLQRWASGNTGFCSHRPTAANDNG